MRKWLRTIGVQFGVTFVALALLLSIGGPIFEHAPQAIQKAILTIGFIGQAYAVPPDYQVDGTADDVEVSQALNALPATGGKLILYAGNWKFNVTVSRAINNVTIEGDGKGTYLANNGSTALFSAGSQTGWVFKDFRTDAGWITVSSAGDTLLAGNLWKGTSLVSNVVASGTTMPTSPVKGQEFLHSPTGRTVFYQYDGTAWQPIRSYGTITAYVDPTGTNDLAHGQGTGTNAFQTIAYAYSMLPPIFQQAQIYVGAGTYTESNDFEAKGGRVYLIGSTTTTNLTATGGTRGTVGTANTPTVTGTFTPGAYDNKLIKFTSGSNNGYVRVVGQTTATTLYLIGHILATAPVNSDTYQILDWATTISGFVHLWGAANNGTTNPANSVGVGSQGDLILQYMAISATNGGAQSAIAYSNRASIFLQQSKLSNSSTGNGLMAEVGAFAQFWQSVLVNPATGAATSVIGDWGSQIDLTESRITGFAKTENYGIFAQDNGIVTVDSCEISNFNYLTRSSHQGLLAFYGNDVKSFLHAGNSAGNWAIQHGVIVQVNQVQYGTKLDGTADANGINEANDNPGVYSATAPFSYIGN